MKTAGREGAPRHVLVVKPGSMGDVVHALPTASAIARAWPETQISWIVDRRWAPLLDGNPHISRVIEFPRTEFRGLPGLARGAKWMAALRGLKPDICVDLQCLFRSALMAKVSGARRIVGLSDAREFAGLIYSDSASVVPGEHSVLRYLRVLGPLGIPAPQPPEFPLPPGSKPAGVAAGGYLLVNPGARGQGKSLPPETLSSILGELGGRAAVVVGASPSGPLPSGAVDLRGKTSLPELLWLIRHADAVLSVDSGPSHLAADLDKPLLAIHTWADPRSVGPFSENALVWQSGRIEPWKTCSHRPGDPPSPPHAPQIAAALLGMVP